METLVFFTSTTKWLFSNLHFVDLVLASLGFLLILSFYEHWVMRGPMAWPFIGMIPSFVRHIHELHDWNAATLVECGGTYRFRALVMSGYRGIMTSDPVKIEYMLKTNFHNFPKGEYFRERFRDLLGDGIFNVDDALWKEQRRVVTSEMHTARFVEFSLRTIQTLVREKLLPLIESRATKSPLQPATYIDLQEWLLRFTFDNVCAIALGVDPGCLTLDLPEIPFAVAFEQATEISLFRFLVPPFLWKPLRIMNLGKEAKLKQATKVVHDFVNKTIKEKKVDPTISHNSDLLSQLMGATNPLSDQLLRDMCTSFILAGRDTSSVALAWFFWLVHNHPEVERKILEEINGIKKLHESEDFAMKELERMVYLKAALTEAMRLYPPVPIDFKIAQEGDVYPDGTKVKKFDRVFYHIYATGRMEAVWGRDCNEFRPERWVRDGRFMAESQFKYTVFNAGPRLCVGKRFAYVQMKMVAASVLRRYKVVVKEGHLVAPKITTTLYMKHGLQVCFHPREGL